MLRNTEFDLHFGCQGWSYGYFLCVCVSCFYLSIYLWLCWVFVSVRGFSLAVASGGHSSSRCVGLSLSRPLLLRSTGSRGLGSVIVAHGPSCSVACGIFPDQGSNPCPLHWQADSQPLRHQGSPIWLFYYIYYIMKPQVEMCLHFHIFQYIRAGKTLKNEFHFLELSWKEFLPLPF